MPTYVCVYTFSSIVIKCVQMFMYIHFSVVSKMCTYFCVYQFLSVVSKMSTYFCVYSFPSVVIKCVHMFAYIHLSVVFKCTHKFVYISLSPIQMVHRGVKRLIRYRNTSSLSEYNRSLQVTTIRCRLQQFVAGYNNSLPEYNSSLPEHNSSMPNTKVRCRETIGFVCRRIAPSLGRITASPVLHTKHTPQSFPPDSSNFIINCVSSLPLCDNLPCYPPLPRSFRF